MLRRRSECFVAVINTSMIVAGLVAVIDLSHTRLVGLYVTVFIVFLQCC